MGLIENFLFIVFPYIAIVIFLVGTIYRYRSSGFRYSSLSSQFLEGQKLFWGSIPFHWGLVVLFFGHLALFLFPDLVLWWNSDPTRLLIMEGLAYVFGLSVLFGLVGLLIRRMTNDRLKMVTNHMDVVIELLIFAQVILGLWTALEYRWGSSWFAATLSPYLWSIAKFNPRIDAVVAMPMVVQLHIVGAFIIMLLTPFTRLVHFLVAPFHYVSRPYQQVIWNWDRKRVRSPESAWSHTQPKNN